MCSDDCAGTQRWFAWLYGRTSCRDHRAILDAGDSDAPRRFSESRDAVCCRRADTRGWTDAVVIAALSVIGTALSPAPPSEYQVKAEFLLSFVTFTEWPTTAFETPASPLWICIAGPDPFEGALVRTLQDQTVAGHPLVAEHLDGSEETSRCHVLFVPRGADDRRLSLDRDASSPLLVVGESDALWREGATINFAVEDGRVRFDVNRTAAERSGLQLSSKLLNIARLVR